MAKSRAYADANPRYWQGYSNLQHVKHALIREYLNGWFPKLGLTARRILYIDTHAGRGRHDTGDLGSPLVALKTLLSHKFRDRILQRSEVEFIFLERDSANLRQLQAELSEYQPSLPRKVTVNPQAGDFQEVLEATLQHLTDTQGKMAPSFIFVDPYGFNIPYPVLARFMGFSGVELFINVMWRYLDMVIAQARADLDRATPLDFVFGPTWRDRIVSDDFETRCTEALSLIKDIVRSTWATSVRMLGHNRATEYVLLHLSNHPAGRDLMKDVMWKVCPASGQTFVARKTDDPAQGILLDLDPDLRPLEREVVAAISRCQMRWQELYTKFRDTSWLNSHVNKVVRELRARGRLVATDYRPPFSAKSNPLLTLKEDDSP